MTISYQDISFHTETISAAPPLKQTFLRIRKVLLWATFDNPKDVDETSDVPSMTAAPITSPVVNRSWKHVFTIEFNDKEGRVDLASFIQQTFGHLAAIQRSMFTAAARRSENLAGDNACPVGQTAFPAQTSECDKPRGLLMVVPPTDVVNDPRFEDWSQGICCKVYQDHKKYPIRELAQTE